jgi:hypothetical protein
VLQEEVKEINNEALATNEKLSKLADCIDTQVWKSYKLWPSNYIAHDLLYAEQRFANQYTPAEKEAFEKRLAQKVNANQPLEVENFLRMYANPVANQLGLSKEAGAH